MRQVFIRVQLPFLSNVFWKNTTYADSISQDAIADAAIEQLVIDLYESNLTGNFIASFMPSKLDDWKQEQENHDGVLVDNPDGDLLPLLEDFHNNLHSVDMDTGISNRLAEDRVISAMDTATAYAKHISEKCLGLHWDLRLNAKAWITDNDELINAIRSREGLAGIEQWGQSRSTSSLQAQDEGIVLENLRLSVTGAKADASFCCGASVAIKPFAANTVIVDSKAASPPVILHWDQPDGGPGRMTFGDEKTSSAEFHAHIQNMRSSCQAATFGRQGQDVYDATYREALKLEPSQFTTNFHPHDYGILDDLAQILLPSYLGGDREDEDLLGVHAELYKLNVYSAPSGIFKSHVDTPRSDNQFGSLVVCLPASHEGGNLVIRHNSRVANYDWSSSKDIEWAAFYSDCEHEVLQVTQGHRITLTYNLTFVYSRGLPPKMSTRVYKTPLYNDLQAALEKPGFMAKGGILGFACNHSYAHSRKSEDRLNLPAGLKGVDMIIYATFAALGLHAAVRPVLDDSRIKRWFEDEDIRQRHSDARTNKARKKLQRFQRLGPNEAGTKQVELTGSSMGLTLDYADKEFDIKYLVEKVKGFRARLAHIKANRYIKGLGEPPSSDTVDHVGHRFHKTELPRKQVEESSDMKEVRPASATRFVHLEPAMTMLWS
jgi:hypothetical protein